MRVDWRTIPRKYTPDSDKFPYGLRFYDGVMGCGKTLSMVHDVYELARCYPNIVVASNVLLRDVSPFAKVIQFSTTNELIQVLQYLSTSVKHSVVIVDEALSYFAENGGIDPALMSSITQLRKNRIFCFIATQKFKRLNNRLRDFSLETVQCSHFGSFQFNVVRDDQNLIWDKDVMDFVGTKKYSYLFKRNNQLFDLYDTYQKIDPTAKVSSLFTGCAPQKQAASEQALVEKLCKKIK